MPYVRRMCKNKLNNQQTHILFKGTFPNKDLWQYATLGHKDKRRMTGTLDRNAFTGYVESKSFTLSR